MFYHALLRGTVGLPNRPLKMDIGLGAAALIGGGSALGSLASGLFGASAQKSANNQNYKIWQEQKEFNRIEAQKQRDWQQRMQDMYGTSSAKANDLRTAGLNAYLGDVSASQVGSGSTASVGSAPEMQPVNPMSGIGGAIQSGANTFSQLFEQETARRSQQSQEAVNTSIENLNKMRATTEELVQSLKKQDFRIGEQTLQQMEYNTEYLQRTLDSRVRQQYTNECIAEWQRQDIKYNALTQQYELYNLAPAKVQETLSNIAYNSAAAFNQFAQGKLTYRQFLNYPKELAIRQTFAQASVMQGRAALMSGKAALMNAQNYGRLLRSQTKQQDMQNEQTQFYNDYWLGNVSTDDAIRYIKRDIPIWSLYKTNLGIAQQTFTNLTLQPTLIKSMTRANNAGASRDEWGKWSDAIRTASDAVDTGFNIYTRGVSTSLKRASYKLDYDKAHATKRTRYNDRGKAEFYEFE